MSVDDSERALVAAREEELPKRRFIENSTLGEIEARFPTLLNRSFTQWLEYLSEKGKKGEKVAILEVGGGIPQVAASEILGKYKSISKYVALEKKPIEEATVSGLKAIGNYQYIQAGISETPQVLRDKRFDLAFASLVAEHMVIPYFLVKELYSVLKEGGVLFSDFLLVNRQLWEKRVAELRKKEFNIGFSYVEVLSPDLALINLALQRKGPLPSELESATFDFRMKKGA